MAIFTNRATLTYNNTVTNSNIVTGEIVDSLTAVKTAVSDTYSAGETVTYIISLVSTAESVLTGITVTDNLGAYTFGSGSLVPLTYKENTVRYYVNGVLQPTPTVTSGDTLTVSGISVPAGGNAVIVYSADVNGFAPLSEGSIINNTVTVTSTGITNTVSASETITAASGASLTIAKALSPQAVTENGTVTYTFTVSNYGNSALGADGYAVITDTFDPVLSGISVSFNGNSWSLGTNYTYDAASGAFATVAGQLTVPAATYTQNATTGEWTVRPGTSVLTVTGTIS